MNNHVLSATESILTHLICADASGEDNIEIGGKRFASDGTGQSEQDAGSLLDFEPERPSITYTTQLGDNDRLYTRDSGLLMNSVQDVIGRKSEFAIMTDDRVKWTCFKRIKKAPRGVWVSSPGATLYECHYREIFANGLSTYFKRVVGVSSRGKPVACIVQGSHGEGAKHESGMLIMGASIIEDAHRSGAFLATVSEDASIRFPVPIGEHRDVFALRDAPLTKAGRRKAILHWVSGHMRKTARGESKVKTHLRGVREFTADGLTVRLEPNER